jgi:small subunit ribosomal protein S13
MSATEKTKQENFLYIVRIANRDLDGERSVYLALSDLKGVGHRLADIMINALDLPKNKRIGELSEDQIEKLKEYVEAKEYEGIPEWALNHRREIVTGKSLNLVSNDLDIQVQDDINAMKKMRSYKGVRHEKGHKVRGQRTRSNGRRGLAIGVIKNKEGQQQ